MRTPGRSDTDMMVLSSSAFEDGQEIPQKVSLEAFTRAVEPNALATARLVGKFTKVRTR
jgi:hypothetical protein